MRSLVRISQSRYQLPLLIGIASLLLFSPTARGADVVSTLVATGDWNDDTRWDSTLFPDNGNGGLTYDAVINSSTVTIPALVDIAIESLTLTGGTLGGEGSLSLDAGSDWTGGTLMGIGNGLDLDGLGVLAISGGTFKFFRGSVSNAGSMVWTQGAILPGLSGSTFSNSGTIDLQGDGASFQTSQPGSLVNEVDGTLARTSSTAAASISLPFTNHGTVDVDTGTLQLSGGGSSSGVFEIASGAALGLAGGNFTFDSGASSTGAGQVTFSSGTVSIAGDTSLSNLTVSAGTLEGTGGTLTVSSELAWTGGTFTDLELGAGSNASISGATFKFFRGSVSNAGSMVWTQGALLPGLSGSTFSNSGTIDLQGDGASFQTSQTGTVANEVGGTLSRTIGTGTASISLPFTNQGTVDVATGTLQLSGGGSSSGAFNIASGAVLGLAGGNFTFDSGASSTGAGQVTFSSGTVSIAGDTSLSNLTVSAGTLEGTGGMLTVSSDLAWTGGTFKDLELGAGSNASISGATFKFFSGSVSNAGSMVWTQGALLPGLSGSTFSNSGTIDLQGDGASFQPSQTGTVANEVGGTLSRTIGTGTASISLPFDNHGTVDVDTGTLQLSSGGSSSGAFAIASGAELRLGGGTFTFDSGASSTGAGDVTLTNGTVRIAGNTSFSNLTVSGGTLEGTGGQLTVSSELGWNGGTFKDLELGAGSNASISGATFKFFSGSVSNAGSMVWTQGLILPGLSGSTFSNSGTIDLQGDGPSFQPSQTGTLANEVGGTLSRTIGTGIASISLPFSNQGTVDVATGTLRLSSSFDNYDAATSTLSGGAYRVAGAFQFNNVGIATNQADITLDGPTSQIANLSSVDALANFALNDIGANIAILNNRDLTTTADFINRSTLQIGGGTFDALSLENAAAGEIFGLGTITPQVANSGTVRAAGGTLSVAGGIDGSSGTVQMDAGASLNLSGAGSDSTADLLIHNGSGLNLGTDHFVVSGDYTNANFGAGNAFDHRENVSGAGEIRAAGDASQILTGDITGGATALPVLAFGNVHVGVPVTLDYRITNAGTTGPSLRGAIQTTVGGADLTDSRLSGSGVTAANVGPILIGADTGDLAVTFAADTTGPLTGQAVRLTNNFDNVGTQLLAITGTAWQLANASAHLPEPVDLGIVHVGDVAEQAITLSNQAANDGFAESLNASFVATTGAATATGSIALLAPGVTDSMSLLVGIDTSSAGAKQGTATLGLESDGAGTSELGASALASQTVNVTAQVNHFAVALVEQLAGDGTLQQTSATSYTLDLGAVVRGSGMLSTELGVTNNVSAPADSLAGDFVLDVADFTLTGFGPFADIGAGTTQSGLDVEFASATVGQFDRLITLNPRSENSDGFSGALPQVAITLTARVVLEADFDLDSDVDGADLDLWRAGYGVGTSHAQGDADGDNDVDGSDFFIWQRQFTGNASVLATQETIPEPATSLLLILGTGSMLCRRCRYRSPREREGSAKGPASVPGDA